MTLVEVLFAIVLLSGVMLAMARFGQSFIRVSRESAVIAGASDLAYGRLEVVRAHRLYRTLATFAATETSATTAARPSMAEAAGFTRVTTVTRDSTATSDVTRVTVTVTSAVLSQPVAKTAVIARF